MNSDAEAPTFHILLVEDNAADIYLLRQALKGTGLNFELTVIEDGAEALAFVRRQGNYGALPIPNLAVLDLNLPKNGGAAVLEALRRNQDLSHVPVAIMSSTAEPREQARTKQLGIQRFITKPPDLEDFLQIGQVLKEMLLERSDGPSTTDSANIEERKH